MQSQTHKCASFDHSNARSDSPIARSDSSNSRQPFDARVDPLYTRPTSHCKYIHYTCACLCVSATILSILETFLKIGVIIFLTNAVILIYIYIYIINIFFNFNKF